MRLVSLLCLLSSLMFVATAEAQRSPCSIEISGPKFVCLECDKKGEVAKDQTATILTAKGTPSGGTYSWKVAASAADPAPEGKVRIQQGRNAQAGVGPEKLLVYGVSPSKPKDDVSIVATYKTADQSEPCTTTWMLTVVKPSSVKLIEEQKFVVVNGAVQGAVPDKYKEAVNGVMKKLDGKPDKKDYRGVILIRFLSILDQFNDVIQCSKEKGLDEEITPKSVEQRGTDITNGVPAQPDHVYLIGAEKKNKPFAGGTVVQVIDILHCPVQYNEFVFTADAVTRTELTKKQYEAEKKKLRGN